MARRQKKPRRPVKPRFRINNQIRAPKIRLVGDNLADISAAVGREITSEIYSTREAIKMADALDMDLIEISPKADPPVCRITDYKKFLFDKKKKEKEMKAKTVKTVIKEIRFGPNTDDHDFNFKARHAEKFLQDGAKVKAYVHFRGRTIVFKERGEVLLLRFVKHLEEFGTIESMPRMEGRRMFVMIAPKKSALKASKKSKPTESKSDKKKAKAEAAKKDEDINKVAVSEAPESEVAVSEAPKVDSKAPASKVPKAPEGDAPVNEVPKAPESDAPVNEVPKTPESEVAVSDVPKAPENKVATSEVSETSDGEADKS